METQITRKERWAFGLAGLGQNMVYNYTTAYIMVFYTDVALIAPIAVGTLMLVARVFDAVNDPILGNYIDRHPSPKGKLIPYLKAIPIPMFVISVLVYFVPDMSPALRLLYAYVSFILWDLMYTVSDVPYWGLSVTITADPKERVACQSYRFVMVGIATLLLSLTLLPMADWFGGADKAKGYQMAMTVLAFIGMCMFLFCFATVRERIRPAVQTNDELKKDLKDVWKNDQWVRILLLTLCNVCPGFIRMAATMYYVTWVMGQSTHFATLFISLGVVGMMIGSMLAKVLTDRWCKLQVFFWTNIVLAVFSCAFYFFNPHATTLIMVLYFLLNILHQLPSPLHWSLMSDVDDYGEWKTGKRITGISFSGNLFFLKVGLAVAGAMVGFLLSWYGYDAGAKAQSASALNGIVLLFSVIPGVGYLITAGVVRLLKVDRTLMRQIQSDLEKRRSNYSELNEYQELKTSEHVRKA